MYYYIIYETTIIDIEFEQFSHNAFILNLRNTEFSDWRREDFEELTKLSEGHICED